MNETRKRRGRIGGQPPGLRFVKEPPAPEEEPTPAPRKRAAKKKTAKKKTTKKKATKKKATKRRGR